jgi:hypothetical protein
MLMVIPDLGKVKWLTWALFSNGADFENYILRLYQNNVVPTDASVTATFTEATFPGYAAVPVPRADFNDPVIIADVAISTCTFVPTYTCTGGAGQLVYGWFFVGATSNVCLAAQRFDFARNMTAGTSELINPFQFALKSYTVCP